jgi:conjugal transfer pilus assembly protein TraW
MKYSDPLCSARYWPAALALVLLAPAATSAANLGVVGPVYPIAEQNALSLITNTLKAKEKSGELARLEKEAIKRSMHSLKNPLAVPDLGQVTQRSSRLIDPTVRYAQAITTDEGQIVVPAGARINPLDVMSLSKTLVFFDGRDAAQVTAVHKMVLKNPRVKPILVAGSWLEIGRAWKQTVFFDQRGALSKRFEISAVPTVIRQQGRALLLEEIPTRELR